MKRSDANLGLRKPCHNCPFLKEGAIELEEGRLEGIAESLMDDSTTFFCHKTVHYDREELHNEETGNYCGVGDEQQCAGAIIYLLKKGRWNIRMRLAKMMGAFSPQDYVPHFDKVIDPEGYNG